MVYKDMFRDVCLLVFEDIVGDSQGHGLQGHVVFMYVCIRFIFFITFTSFSRCLVKDTYVVRIYLEIHNRRDTIIP